MLDRWHASHDGFAIQHFVGVRMSLLFDPPILLPCTLFIVTEASSRNSSLESILLLAGLLISM